MSMGSPTCLMLTLIDLPWKWMNWSDFIPVDPDHFSLPSWFEMEVSVLSWRYPRRHHPVVETTILRTGDPPWLKKAADGFRVYSWDMLRVCVVLHPYLEWCLLWGIIPIAGREFFSWMNLLVPSSVSHRIYRHDMQRTAHGGEPVGFGQPTTSKHIGTATNTSGSSRISGTKTTYPMGFQCFSYVYLNIR